MQYEGIPFGQKVVDEQGNTKHKIFTHQRLDVSAYPDEDNPDYYRIFGFAVRLWSFKMQNGKNLQAFQFLEDLEA